MTKKILLDLLKKIGYLPPNATEKDINLVSMTEAPKTIMGLPIETEDININLEDIECDCPNCKMAREFAKSPAYWMN